jgi:2-iminobutanoate/2-iminopropanoate deaminase
VRKSVIDPDYGQGFKYLEGSRVSELSHSAGVVIDLGEASLVYCSGKTATNDQSSDQRERDSLVGGDSVREQTRQVLRNLQGVLAAAGGNLDHVVRVRVYVVAPMTPEMFGQIHEARAEFFKKEHYPASTLVVVSALARPGALIEIDADAVIPRSR